MAELDKDFRLAESIYLENNRLDEAIEMYQSLCRWDDAIDIAEAKVITFAEQGVSIPREIQRLIFLISFGRKSSIILV
jgi:hypothetical protein